MKSIILSGILINLDHVISVERIGKTADYDQSVEPEIQIKYSNVSQSEHDRLIHSDGMHFTWRVYESETRDAVFSEICNLMGAVDPEEKYSTLAAASGDKL